MEKEDRERGSEGRPLQIMMVAPTSFFAHYGGHIRILEEARALQEFGHQVTIVTYYKGEDVGRLHIERTWPLPWRADYEVGSSRHKLVFDLFLGAKVLQIGRRLRPDLVHGHMHEGALLGGVLARLLRIPLVFDFQGSLTGEMIDHGFIRPRGVGHAFWRRLEGAICKLPDAILTSSLRAQELLGDHFGVPQERIYPLPDCVDMNHFDPGRRTEVDTDALRRRFSIPPGRPIVAYLGLLADYQGTPHLIEAAAHLKAAGEDVHFLIMGYPGADVYRAMARRLGVADRVTLSGRVDYCRDAPRFLSLGDVAVSPKVSTTEGSGKVLNYMAMAQPIVAYDTPVHREYLGEWGIYVPPGDVEELAQAIGRLLHDPARRRHLGDHLRRRAARHYSWQAAAQRIDDLYKNLVQQNSVRIPETV